MQTTQSYLEIDGSIGEGGGQIIRSALSLSICTGKAFRITNIRSGRRKPGLQRQHLTAVHAARDISGAELHGDEIGSTTLTFIPNGIWAGNYHFDIGTAGSTTLVLQTILYPMLLADKESTISLKGGTHNMYAPPYDFLAKAFLPILNRMGAKVELKLDRYGFFPKGGGKLTLHITPSPKLSGISLMERGNKIAHQARALITGIPEHVALRELERVAKKLKWPKHCLHHCPLPRNQGPGNVLLLELQSENVTEIFTGFAQIGVKAETVADKAIKMAKNYLATDDVPVGEYLADQLLLPLALAGEGEFTTIAPSLHTMTNIEIIQMFLSVNITTRELKPDVWIISAHSLI